MKKILTSLTIGLFCLTATTVKAELPAGALSVFDVLGLTEMAPLQVAGATQQQLLGPGSGWGNMADLNLSEYKTILLNLTYSAADAGKQVAVRFNVNATADATNVKFALITLPSTGTNYTAEIDILQYAGAGGEIFLGGFIYYSGASHWSFTYDGTPAAEPITIEYFAVTKIAATPTNITKVNVLDPNALVDVYSVTGAIVRKSVKTAEATNGLTPGIYLVGGKKVVVTKQ